MISKVIAIRGPEAPWRGDEEVGKKGVDVDKDGVTGFGDAIDSNGGRQARCLNFLAIDLLKGDLVFLGNDWLKLWTWPF